MTRYLSNTEIHLLALKAVKGTGSVQSIQEQFEDMNLTQRTVYSMLVEFAYVLRDSAQEKS